MHPEIRLDAPGICPECGMNLIKAKTAIRGAGKHTGHSTKIFLRKFWVNLILTIPVVLYSDIFEKIFGWKPPVFFGSEYVPLVLGSIIFFYGGWIFIVGALRELKARLPGMMTLIGLAIATAYTWSVYAVLAGAETLFWELATLITVMLLGHYMEMKAVSGAQGALKELSKLMPDTAELILGTSGHLKKSDFQKLETKTISIDKLKVGDLVLIRPGGRIPADGIIIEGESEVNEAMITGESAPVTKEIGSRVIAGTVNGDGSLKIKVSVVGKHTFLAGIMRLVKEAQASKSRLQILSDKAAFYLTLIAVGGGGLTFAWWLAAQAGFAFATERMVAVLVIACPHALGLAVPLVASISTTMAARHGFLVRDRIALEMAREISAVLFDKTGTLTKGEYGVAEIIGEKKILQLAASVDSQSEHFIAKAIVQEARKRKITLLDVKDFKRIPGKGVSGKIGGKKIAAGGEAILSDRKIVVPENLSKKIYQLSEQGKTIIYVLEEDNFLGAIALADIIREESRAAARDLKKMGVKVAMITGDSEGVAKWVAGELGIKEYFSRVLPGQKSEKIKLLQRNGLKVAMVGDGINDAPALVQADLGIAIGAGTNVAIESAGIILVRDDPRDIAKIIKLSRMTYGKMLQNLFWATGYNVIALPLAAGVLAYKGILLQPALAALFMSLSTVIVAINAIFLKNKAL